MAIATVDTSVAEQVAAVRGGLGVFDLSDRGKLRVTGSERATWFHGMGSNDVEGLSVGAGNLGAVLTDRGKMLGDYRLIVREEDLLVDTEPGLGAALAERLDRFLISEDAAISDEADAWSLFGIAGPAAAARLSDRLSVDVGGLEEHASLTATTDDGDVTIACRNRTGEMGYDLWIARDAGEALWATLTADGVAEVGADALEALRIEAAIARYGMDTDEDIIPLEAGLYQAIDFEKGCYVGQEIVARMHYRGHPNKLLVGLRFDGEPTVELRAELFEEGDDSKARGFVTSLAHSPTLGAMIGLGYARTQFAEAGSRLRAAAADGFAWVEVVPTPFVPSPFPEAKAP
ncbi:folate-binding protein YgfZ [Candidatus Poribacteria bacterium]|jgi:folate-binding protein YgfZ|nr:folate-binding protein YgfZ [Candidatus Poribacteria bacterium]MBT5531880.1 folate-binding protein YgfZ [Candidatus Poribacteria bacterium]MBT5712599.1 folate-binding protein YgfZ [Candidatus Poribacteria bacterium]MBT7095818.1 folate-binding protein YgfZ [Candidatus Poribacteria bacterium]MBT7805528.1 folate-binding protein YgfZ [Candidatus Poribacteria bacterium]